MIDTTKTKHRIPCPVCRNNDVNVKSLNLMKSAASLIVAHEIVCDKCDSTGRITETWFSDSERERAAHPLDNVCKAPAICSNCGNPVGVRRNPNVTTKGNEINIASGLNCTCGNIGQLEERWITE